VLGRSARNLAQNDYFATRFLADDPDYEPNDSAMVRIHCRILATDL
jgi:hypothetical protein